jgi:hypothetical protein
MSRPPQHRRAGYSKAKLRDDFYAVIDGGRLTPLEDKSQVVEAMTEGPFERFTARGSFAFCRPFLLIARRDEARLIAVFVNIPIAHDHLYLRSHRLVGGSRPTCVSSLPKPHLFLQLRQSDCVVVHGIPSPSPSDTETVGCNDGRILSFVGLKEGGGPLSPHFGFG